jgi:hypothetical protein
MLVGKEKLYAIGPILSRISNGPYYLGVSLAQVPSFKELLCNLSLDKMFSKFKLFMYYFLPT